MKLCFADDWMTTYNSAELALKNPPEILVGTPIYTLAYDQGGYRKDIINQTRTQALLPIIYP